MHIRSDRLDYLKKSQADFFQITSNQSIYHDESDDAKFGFGVNLLNLIASAVRGVRETEKLMITV